MSGVHHPQSADHGPIDPAERQMMHDLARSIDDFFNGENCPPERKKVGFFLTTFPFNETGRFNYISNADKADVRAMLADILARLEARLLPPGTA